MANIKVTVLPGMVVQYNKKTSHPGECFSCEESEANRLNAAGIVTFDDIPGDDQLQSGQQLTAARQRQLIIAITTLDADKTNQTHWTKSGLPQTIALSRITCDVVTAAERDEAYAQLQLLMAQEIQR